MATTNPTGRAGGPREIMRYVRIRQSGIIDIAQRVAASPSLKGISAGSVAVRKAWARAQLKSGHFVQRLSDLRFDYLAYLGDPDPLAGAMPTRASLKDPKAFAAAKVASDAGYRADLEDCLASVFASKVLDDEQAAQAAARVLAFVERFPNLDKAQDAGPYPYPALRRIQFHPSVAAKPPAGPVTDSREQALDELAQLSKNLDLLWRAKNGLIVQR
ncbi:MAG: hypothetical protein RIQ60_4536, partial [Pseudomonadota bacterium]